MALRIRFQYPPASKLGYSIERLSDGTFYDFSNAAFVATTTTLIASLPEDTGPFIGRYKVTLDPTPVATFTDGDYVVTAHDLANLDTVVAELGTTMHSGDDATESLTTPTNPTVGDAGFEAVNPGAAGYVYRPTGSAWTFSGLPGNGSGVTGNNSGFTSGNPAAPQGSKVAFLQGKGSITQSVAGWAAGSYTISFAAAQRGNVGGVEDFEVLVDDNIVGTFKPATTSYQLFTTSPFTATAGPHVIEFLGLNTAGGDNTAFIDIVAIVPA